MKFGTDTGEYLMENGSINILKFVTCFHFQVMTL